MHLINYLLYCVVNLVGKDYWQLNQINENLTRSRDGVFWSNYFETIKSIIQYCYIVTSSELFVLKP